ncbi:MAG: DUF4124 domain-containing protein, partial [Lysobacterales bacterium]
MYVRLLIVLAFAGQACASEVFKCRARNGGISYQDRACGVDAETLEVPLLSRNYLPPPLDPSISSRTHASKIEPPPVASIRVEDPLPQMFRCTS